MKEYFSLQFKMLNRKLIEIGLAPTIGYPLGVFAFYGLSAILFSKTDLAEYFYGFIGLSFMLKLSEQKRNDFLKTVFSVKNYQKIRILESLVIILPFVFFLLFKQSFIVATLLVIVSFTVPIQNFNSRFNITMPTPFGKKPFEFPVGFRKTFYIFPFAYFLTFQSILVNNYNLGVSSILLVAIVVFSYYSKPENEYYIWSFNISPKSFLIEKTKTGLLFFSFLILPILISLIIFYPEKSTTLVLSVVLCYTYIFTIILAKYSAYPNEINLREGILIGFSLMFPPIVIGVIPYFYLKSKKQLRPLLEDD